VGVSAQASFALVYGAVEAERPIATPLLAQRTWMEFESKEAAIRWSTRHAPKIPAGVHSVSAHPRARKTATGGWALVYDGIEGTPRKFALTKKLGLERTR